MLWKEAIYMALDELKSHSDDAVFTEDHITFLLSKYRAFILKQKYSDIKKQMPEANYQTLCLELEEVPAIAGAECEAGTYLRTTNKIPNLIGIGVASIYPVNYFNGQMISYISRDRMKYVGYNKYLQNIIYAALGPDNYLYFKSANPQYLYLEKVRMTALFENPLKAFELNCGGESCDYYDTEFPLEYSLFPQVLELIVKELLRAEYRPSDVSNNAADNLPDNQNGARQ